MQEIALLYCSLNFHTPKKSKGKSIFVWKNPRKIAAVKKKFLVLKKNFQALRKKNLKELRF